MSLELGLYSPTLPTLSELKFGMQSTKKYQPDDHQFESLTHLNNVVIFLAHSYRNFLLLFSAFTLHIISAGQNGIVGQSPSNIAPN
jgi:hypothetical protein